MGSKVIIYRCFVALLAIIGVTVSISHSIYVQEFDSFWQVFAQFTYIANISVAIILFLIVAGKLSDEAILVVLPSIVLTFIVFSLFLSKGIANETFYSVIEHYLVASLLTLDFLFLVKRKTSFIKGGFFALSIVVLYLCYVFFYGYLTDGYYPYFLFDLTTHSLANVMQIVLYINILLLVLFIVFYLVKALQMLFLYEKIK